MLETIITILVVTLFVLGLFGIVRWVLSFFPRLNSTSDKLAQGKWWIVLLLIVIWLEKASELLDQGNKLAWSGKQFLNAFYLIALTYCIWFVWTRTQGSKKDAT